MAIHYQADSERKLSARILLNFTKEVNFKKNLYLAYHMNCTAICDLCIDICVLFQFESIDLPWQIGVLEIYTSFSYSVSQSYLAITL